MEKREKWFWNILALLVVGLIIVGLVFGTSMSYHFLQTGTFSTAYRIVRIEQLDGKIMFRVQAARENDIWMPSKTFFGPPDQTEDRAMGEAVEYFNKLIKAQGVDTIETVIKKVP